MGRLSIAIAHVAIRAQGAADRVLARLDVADATELAQRLLIERDYDGLRRFADRAVERFPGDPELRLLYGTSLVDHRPEDAPQEIARAIALDPSDPERVYRAASLLFRLGETEAARSYVAQVDRLAPEGFVFAEELDDLKQRLACEPPPKPGPG